MIKYYMMGDEHGRRSVVAFNPNSSRPLYQADETHMNFDRILECLARGDENVFELFDIQGGVMARLRALSDRVSWNGSNVLFDGDAVEGPLAEHLGRVIRAGEEDWEPLVKFWEKVASNPDERSREQLFTWLQSHDFTITDDGDILGYKGVDSSFRSLHSGTAFVDGKRVEGKIPNAVGTIITMPRSQVSSDPNVACHQGLHVGTFEYAKGFGEIVLEVHVNPRDVVSIPSDSGYAKMRTCRYKVVCLRGGKVDSPIHFDSMFV